MSNSFLPGGVFNRIMTQTKASDDPVTRPPGVDVARLVHSSATPEPSPYTSAGFHVADRLTEEVPEVGGAWVEKDGTLHVIRRADGAEKVLGLGETSFSRAIAWARGGE